VCRIRRTAEGIRPILRPVVTPRPYLVDVIEPAATGAPRIVRPTLPAIVRGVVFDGDDTLWFTEPLYDTARAAARTIVEEAGLDGAAWEAQQRRCDVDNVARFGHRPDRFPTSAVEALTAVGGDGIPDAAKVRERVRNVAASVFAAPAPLRSGAREVLAELHRIGLRLALLTKGDREVQQRRIEDSGLHRFFDLTEIVERKSAGVFRSVADQLGLATDELLSVGNSVESDIRPSVDAGIAALWLPAYVWEFEQHDPALEPDLHRIDDLGDVLRFVSRS
jgi:putative hydrolase of the HAD superfamily